MKEIRKKVDHLFFVFGESIIRHRWLVLLSVLATLIFMAFQVPNIKFDTSTEGFFHDEDPAIVQYNAFRNQFGRDEMLIIMIKPKDIFQSEFLEKLQTLHEELEEKVPHVKDITSLVNARYTHGTEGELNVDDLLEEPPETEEEFAEFKKLVLNHPLYKNLLVSENGIYTTISIKTEAYSSLGLSEEDSEGAMSAEFVEEGNQQERPLLTDRENSEIIKELLQITEKYNSEEFQIRVTGTPFVTDYLKRAMQKDMRKFTGLAIGAIALFLLFLFRRIAGMVLPLATVVLSVIFTIGLMTLTGTSLKTPTMILPSFLLAVGIGASVHLMAIFYRHFTGENKNEAISGALEHSGLPILMTGCTTAAGLASFSMAEIAPVADLGYFSALGVLISLFLTLVFIPAALAVLKTTPMKHKVQQKESKLDKLLLACGRLATSYPGRVAFFGGVLLCSMAMGIKELKFAHNTLKWFPSSSEIYQNTTLIDREMKGSVTVEMIIDSKKENGMYDPAILKGIEQLSQYATEPERSIPAGKSVSLVDMIKEIHQALNENQKEFYEIPTDQKVIAQEFLLFENSGSDDLEDLVDSQFSKARLTIKAPWIDASSYVQFIENLERRAKELLGNRAEVSVTGMISLFTKTVDAMMNSTVLSYTIAAGVITIMMLLLMGNLKIGLLSMIPNLAPILFTLGFMGWVGIPLDMFTLLIGSIAIGLAVDDTIHFFHNFRKYFEQTGNARDAVDETLLSTGRAMLVTTLTLTTGFWLFMFATLENLFNFGLLTGITLALAFLGDVLLAPALLTLVSGKDSKHANQGQVS